jgi:tetratricopeptide (TPR) repeat protein
MTISNLGAALNHQGDRNGALKHYHDARRIHQDLHGREHVSVAVDLNNIGVLYRDNAEWALALPFLNDAVEIFRVTVGEYDPRYVLAVASLGMVLFKLDRQGKARQHIEDAVRISNEIYGENHPDVVWFLLVHSGFLEATGDIDGARDAAERGLRISRRVNGENHVWTREAAKYAMRLRSAHRDPRMQRRPSDKIAGN